MLDSDDEPVISASSKARRADEPHTLRFDEPGKDGELPEDGIRETVSSSQLSEGDYPRITTAIDDPLSDMSDSIPYIGDREIRREFGFSEQVTPAEEPVQESAVDELVASGSSSAKGHERVAPAVYTSITTEKERFRVIDGGRQSAEPARSMSVSLDQGAELRHGRRDAINRKILRFVLAYHRAPRNFPALGDVRNPLPEGISNLLELAAMEDAELQGNRLLSGVGVSSEMFRAAVRFYVRRVFLVKGGDHYRVLGLAEGAGQSDVERHYDSLMKLFRREQQPGTVDCVETIGKAY
jgi:hypothetical protein